MNADNTDGTIIIGGGSNSLIINNIQKFSVILATEWCLDDAFFAYSNQLIHIMKTDYSLFKSLYIPPKTECMIVKSDASFLYSGGKPESLEFVDTLDDDDFNY